MVTIKPSVMSCNGCGRHMPSTGAKKCGWCGGELRAAYERSESRVQPRANHQRPGSPRDIRKDAQGRPA